MQHKQVGVETRQDRAAEEEFLDSGSPVHVSALTEQQMAHSTGTGVGISALVGHMHVL